MIIIGWPSFYQPPTREHIRAGSLLRVYRQYMGMPYIALARQAWRYIAIYWTQDTQDTRQSLSTTVEIALIKISNRA